MRILATSILMLATVLPSLAATTWPAGTNTANQTFYGNNNFLGQLRQGGVDVLTNSSLPAGLSWTNSLLTVSGNITTSNQTNKYYFGGIANQYLTGDALGNVIVSGGFRAPGDIVASGGPTFGFIGNGSGLTNANASTLFGSGTVPEVNSAHRLTNATLYGASFSGSSTNLPGAVHTGGRLETNYQTGNWAQTTNGILTLGPSNAVASITMNGGLGGGITATGLVHTFAAGSPNTLVVTNGRVGIGTTIPGSLLTIQGNSSTRVETTITNTNSAGQSDLYVKNDAGVGGSFIAYGSSNVFSANNAAFGADNSIYIIPSFNTANGGSGQINLLTGGYTQSTQTRMVILSNGNVGIGTTAPSGTGAGNLTVSNSVYVGNTLFSTNGVVLPGTGSYIKWSNVGAQTNPPASGAGTAFIFAGTNILGTSEIFTMDGAGVVKQISEHAMDAPPTMLDDSDPFPNVSKEWNDYLGVVRWINRSREALVASGVIKLNANSYEAWLGIQAGANTALLANNNVWATNRVFWAQSAMGTNWYLTMKAFILADAAHQEVTRTETYAVYNARLGLIPGIPGYLQSRSWTSVQNGIQADYATGYTNALAAYQSDVAGGNTNAVAPVWTPPAVQPIPSWLHNRGVN